MAEEKNEVLKKARIEMNYLTGDEEVRRLTELRDKWESDWNSSMRWAREDGENQNKIKIAKKLLSMKMSIEDIVKATELLKEEVLKIKDDNVEK